ncbi:MAG TPA: flagellar hook-length control protein FliK, partial [Nocardioides sp.]
PPTLLAASSSTASSGSNGTVATPAVTAPANATAPATTSQPNPVTTQVVDRIAEMVTSAGSTGEAHRVTLKLQPEALGDVRIVLTVRDGAVHVQLSAHEAAARTLVEDSPELRRMLDLLGTPDARITVREVGTSHGGSWLSNQADQQATGQSNNDSNGQRERDGQHNSTDSNNDQARTPGRSTATDGTDLVTSSSQRTQTVGSHRSTGVDLAM